MLTVKFETGEILTGTTWKTLPHEKIVSLKYKIGNKTIYMTGYESYNHLVEKVSHMGRTPINTKILLVGRYDNKSQMIIINLENQSIQTSVVDVGHEYNGQVTTGWKSGIKELEAIFTIKEI